MGAINGLVSGNLTLPSGMNVDVTLDSPQPCMTPCSTSALRAFFNATATLTGGDAYGPDSPAL